MTSPSADELVPGPIQYGPVQQCFSKEALQERAKEFMRLRFGPVAEMPMADKRYYHEITGILMFYVNHVWGEFGG